MVFKTIVAFIFGSCVGSFLNVCIWRLPRNKSIITPRSYCPSCRAPVRGCDNIPLISYFVLKGRCRNCRGKISPRYFVVELLTGTIFALFYFDYLLGNFPPGELFLYLLLTSALIAITFIDFEHKIIPDKITYPGIVVGLLASLIVKHQAPFIFSHIPELNSFIDSFLGILAGGGLLWAIAVLSKGGMGGGDIKLGAMIGAFLGWQPTLLTLLLAFFVGAVVGVILMFLKLFTSKSLKAAWKKRKSFIPFGPYLALAALVVIFKGQAIMDWYFRIF